MSQFLPKVSYELMRKNQVLKDCKAINKARHGLRGMAEGEKLGWGSKEIVGHRVEERSSAGTFSKGADHKF